MDVNKSLSIIRNVDQVLKDSPTAQLLYQNAPAMLSLFTQMKSEMAMRQLEIDRLIKEREMDLDRFKQYAPTYTKEISLIGQEIRMVQKTVRELASKIGKDPTAEIQIAYANKQISDMINMFNQISINLMMS